MFILLGDMIIYFDVLSVATQSFTLVSDRQARLYFEILNNYDNGHL